MSEQSDSEYVMRLERALEQAETQLAAAQAELAKWKQRAEQRAAGYQATRCACVFDSAKMDDPTRECDYHAELREQLVELRRANESLRAECGLRQIQGYNEGKAAERERAERLETSLRRIKTFRKECLKQCCAGTMIDIASAALADKEKP